MSAASEVCDCPTCLAGDDQWCCRFCHDLARAESAPTPCPACGGAGVVDTSPPGAEHAPWLQTDTDCPACGGSGEITDHDTEES